ncbi:hypothetical protein OLEAN_C27190 [Oleispira antarctica RB-8]|uniref:Dockerin domain-containing protein n=1 Tax=Oleispira antarctica RB-8 TaxID=698738 RepID=R4YPQ0_OLEAN|nr:hypothetical protein OLEAN_C27190 [Oleispira antarctica RB-8]
MKFLSALALLFIVQISSANLSEHQPINPTDDGINLGSQGNKPMLSLFFLRGTGTNISFDGRYLAYVTEHENLSDPLTIDYIAHRYDKILNETTSSERLMKNSKKDGPSFSLIYFEDSTSQSILFTHDVVTNDGSSSTTHRYSFLTNEVSLYKPEVEVLWSVSPNGRFLKYDKDGTSYYFDKDSNEEKLVPVSYTLANGNVVNFQTSAAHGLDINDQGDLILQADHDSKDLLGSSRFYKYNVTSEIMLSVKDMLPSNYDINITKGTVHTALLSNNSQYITLPARNELGELVILLIDTISSVVVEHHVPFEVYGYGGLLPRLLTNTGIVQYVRSDTGSDGETGGTEFYLYDFIKNQVIERKLAMPEDQNFTEFQTILIDQISVEGNVAITYDVTMTLVSGEVDVETSLSWLNLASESENEISITPVDSVIDPYSNQVSQFSVDVSGTDIYGLDVNCNIASESLFVTEANYEDVFGSQNTTTLPLIYNANSIAAKETLIAPELSFTGAGSFVLADVIAEFTTENVEITCAAEILDENGQLLQAVSTSATILIDDGIHGGTGSVSGSLNIPGVTDLSGREVVLTIVGRQVTVITDETGHYEFEGLRDGDFTISLESDRYVQSCQAASVSGSSSVDLGSIELLAGDVNSDGSIGVADFMLVASRYRSIQGDGFYDSRGDFNADGTINIQDLLILDSNFGSTQCNPLPQ